MRRAAVLLIVIFVLVLVAPLMLRRALVVSGPVADPEHGNPALVIITPHNQDIRREFAAAYMTWHQQHYHSPGILDFRSVGGASDIIRALKSDYDAIRNPKTHKLPYPPDFADVPYDVAWGGGDYTFNQLKSMGILTPLDGVLVQRVIPHQMLSGVELYATERPGSGSVVWAGVCLSSFGIVYNPDVLASINISPPVAWDDLMAPALSGRIALADPSHSGSAAVAYMMVLQHAMADAQAHAGNSPAARNQAAATGWKTGMGKLLLIAANARYFTDSSERVPTDVGNGDAAAGMAIDFYGRMEQSMVGDGRARFIAPANATAVTPDPVAVLYGAKHPGLARQFVEFLLSPEGQLLWIKKAGTPGGPVRQALGRPPINPALYADQTDWLDKINPYADANAFNQQGAWMAMQGDLTKMWAASWVDDRDELRAAYQRILAVSDPARRQKLLDKLMNIPFEMSDLTKVAAERKKLSAEGKIDMNFWEAQRRRDWAAKYRAFYKTVADEAEKN